MRNGPDYRQIRKVIELARKRWPDSHEIRPVWYEHRALAEVYTEPGRAFIFDPEREVSK